MTRLTTPNPYASALVVAALMGFAVLLTFGA